MRETNAVNYDESPNFPIDNLSYIHMLNLKVNHCYVKIYLW